MFTSTGNNFGVGTITFKDYQCSSYVVLNAKFTYDPTDDDYQAAEHLEIYVPDLSIERSIECGVFLSFKHRPTASYNNDGATVLKSWIKDKNTICIEKLTDFDSRDELTIWIQTMYVQKKQNSVASYITKTSITMTQETRMFTYSDAIAVIHDNWAFIHFEITNYVYAYRNSTWEATINNFPTDIDSDILLIGGSNQYNPSVDGASVGNISGGVFTLETRTSGFTSTGYTPFVFAFLVRDGEDDEDEE